MAFGDAGRLAVAHFWLHLNCQRFRLDARYFVAVCLFFALWRLHLFTVPLGVLRCEAVVLLLREPRDLVCHP